MNPPTAATSTGEDHATAPAPAPAAAITSSEYARYPTLSPEDAAPPPPPPYHAAATASAPPFSGNPYVSSPTSGAALASKNTMDTVKDVLGKMGKRFGEAARKTENITDNFWQRYRWNGCCRLAAVISFGCSAC